MDISLCWKTPKISASLALSAFFASLYVASHQRVIQRYFSWHGTLQRFLGYICISSFWYYDGRFRETIDDILHVFATVGSLIKKLTLLTVSESNRSFPLVQSANLRLRLAEIELAPLARLGIQPTFHGRMLQYIFLQWWIIIQ